MLFVINTHYVTTPERQASYKIFIPTAVADDDWDKWMQPETQYHDYKQITACTEPRRITRDMLSCNIRHQQPWWRKQRIPKVLSFILDC